MTPEVEKMWRDELSRFIYERDRFKRLAANMRKLAVNLKAQRDFVGALKAESRMRSYRDTSSFYADGVAKARAMMTKG